MLQSFFSRFELNRAKKANKAAKQSREYGRNRRLRHELLEDRRMLAILTVNVLHDDVDNGNPINDGDLTLRDAITYVNGFDPGSLDIESNGVVHIDLTEPLGTNDTILFAPSLDGNTITLGIDAAGNNLDLGSAGELSITNSVTIDAQRQGIKIDASGNDLTPNVNNGDGSRVFDIDIHAEAGESKPVTIDGLTLTGGETKVAEFALAV